MQQGIRKLTAIMAADVVGYSRLMESNEQHTLQLLKSRRQNVLEPLVSKYHGRIFKIAGDGVLVEFSSAVDAVRCAIELQAGMTDASRSEPDEPSIELRVGLNLGDVMVEGSDLYGDGVNIAVRVQAIANRGGIFVTRSVVEQIEGKVSLDLEDLGDHLVKNLTRPVHVYRLSRRHGLEETPRPGVEQPRTSVQGKVSIAVLPFDNISGDPEQGYFSDGITEDIITELSRFRELQVIARNSSFQFRGKSVDVKEIGHRLGAQFLVEGSVRKIGDRVRVTAQLIECAAGTHVWAERYDRELVNIFEIQDEITKTVVVRVAGQARIAAASKSRSRPTESLSAYDNFLRAREMFRNINSTRQAEPFLRAAIQQDPKFALAHALMADVYAMHYIFTGRPEHLQTALASGKLAFELDPEGPWSNYAIGIATMYMGDLGLALHYFNRAINLNPNDMFFIGVRGLCLHFMGRREEALKAIDEVIQRDPHSYDWIWVVRGTVLTVEGDFLEAMKSFHQSQELSATQECYLAICHHERDEMAEAIACYRRAKSAMPQTSPEEYIQTRPYADFSTRARMANILRQVARAAG